MLDEIPRILTLSLAGKIAGLSRKAFLRHYVFSGQCSWAPNELFDWDGRLFIKTNQLSRALGRKITLEECQVADAKLEKKRDYMKAYRRCRKTNT